MLRSKLFIIALLLWQASNLSGQIFPVNEVLIHGDRDKHVNIVFLGDGYTETEMGQYVTDVQGVTNKLMQETPYLEYQSYFNVYAISVPSNESGTDHPGGLDDCGPYINDVFSADTYFDSAFDLYGIHRLLSVQNQSAVYSVLADNLPEWDVAFVIVNHTMYGGSGGAFAVFSLASSSAEIAIHELGHSFANLSDEYWAGDIYADENVNMTQKSNPEDVRWNPWLGEFGIGIYPYEIPDDSNEDPWYRPHQSCKMRYLGVPFCAVCKEQSIKSMYDLVNTIESYQPLENSIELTQDDSLVFRINTKQPQTNSVISEWKLGGNTIQINSDSLMFRAASVEPGIHELVVVVTDTSNLVRKGPNDLLSSSMTWDLLVKPGLSVHEVMNAPSEFQLHQNFPNPFNGVTTFSFYLPSQTYIDFSIYNIQGQLVESLSSRVMSPGEHKLYWDSGDISSGVYVYKITSDKFSLSAKCLLLK